MFLNLGANLLFHHLVTDVLCNWKGMYEMLVYKWLYYNPAIWKWKKNLFMTINFIITAIIKTMIIYKGDTRRLYIKFLVKITVQNIPLRKKPFLYTDISFWPNIMIWVNTKCKKLTNFYGVATVNMTSVLRNEHIFLDIRNSRWDNPNESTKLAILHVCSCHSIASINVIAQNKPFQRHTTPFTRDFFFTFVSFSSFRMYFFKYNLYSVVIK